MAKQKEKWYGVASTTSSNFPLSREMHAAKSLWYEVEEWTTGLIMSFMFPGISLERHFKI